MYSFPTDPDHEKQSRLPQQRVAWLSETDWQTILANFKPTDELRQRVGPELDRYRKTQSENEARSRAVIENQWRHWPAVKYTGTVTAMLLSVIAVGNLLTHRPPTKARWREIGHSGRRRIDACVERRADLLCSGSSTWA